MNYHESAWLRIDAEAHRLGWHNDWTPGGPPWVVYICQRMIWGHMQDQLRQRELTRLRELNNRQEATKGN